MFGIGGGEIILILVIALIFLGPDKLPEAAKQISKGIRDLKAHGRVLQRTIEDDEHIGGAIRDLKSALRGDEIAGASPKPPLRRKKKKKLVVEASAVEGALAAGDAKPTILAPDGTPAIAAAATSPVTDPVVATGAEAVAIAEAAKIETVAALEASDASHGTEAPVAKPLIKLSNRAGEVDDDVPTPTAESDAAEAAELAAMIRPATGTIAKSTLVAAKSEPEHG